MGIAVVTGASSGMGREFVKQIDALGWADEIWAVARREERLLELKENCATPVVPFACDLTDAGDMGRLASALGGAGGKVSLLVNCAGFAKFGGYDEVTAADTIAMIELNITAVVRMVEVCVPNMEAGGRIVNIASTAAFQPLPDMNVYAATKAFVLSYSRALDVELEEHDVSVTAVCPGWTRTEFFDVAKRNADAGAVKNFMFMMKPEAVVKSALRAAKRRSAVCVPGIFNKGHLLFAKILPAATVMTIWEATK